MAPPRSRLAALLEPDAFLWATGIEDTFITEPWPATGRTLDEYELTDHYSRWRDDLELMATLGVSAARYGIPWYRVNPAPGRFDFSVADGPIERLLALGIEPIVDLVHYGTPAWLDRSYLHPDFAPRMAEYAARVAERYRGGVRWYTPLNEPRITAWYCGKLGWWPPFRRGWRGFLEVTLAVCRGVVETDRALHAVDPEIVCAHVDATDLYAARTPRLAAEAELRQAIVFLALDLVTGRVGARHALRGWLARQGVDDRALEYFETHGIEPDVLGLNLYPMFTQKELIDTARGPRVRMPYADGTLVEGLCDTYWARYGRPLFISETASLGSLRRRLGWLDESVGAVRRLRGRGVPVFGYVFWPMFALVGWAYRQGRRPLGDYLLQMGLWDLDRETLARVETPVVGAYRRVVTAGAAGVGRLAPVVPPAQTAIAGAVAPRAGAAAEALPDAAPEHPGALSPPDGAPAPPEPARRA
jgi:beta-glucosidase/6-phospho-beta-glucosidase/beta-galactosidase